MESLCKIRDLYRSITAFEGEFQREFHITLNEGMTLCTLSSASCLTSGELAENLGLTYSNMSKVIKSLEDKGFISRCIGKEDKRQMLFSITKEGRELIETIRTTEIPMPEILQGVIKNRVTYL